MRRREITGLAIALALLLPTALHAQVVRNDTPTTMAPRAAETATEFYMRYQAAIPKATSMEQVLAFWSAGLVRQFNNAPPAWKVDLEGLKGMYRLFTNVKVVKDAATATGATLTLEGVNPDKKKVTGTVNIVNEDGRWKIADQETWQG